MNDLDENGWAHVHHAAYRGFVKSVERFVKANEDQLELETGDDLQSTPMLLSVMSGNLETVQCLVQLGAQVGAVNSQNHGIVELCAFKQYIEVLEYFIKLNHEKVPVWKNLIKFLSSDVDEEAEAAGQCIRTLTDLGEGQTMNPNWSAAFQAGIVPAITKVIKSGIGDVAKVQTFKVLLNLLPEREVCEQFMSSGGMAALVRHLKANDNTVIQLAAQCIKEMCQNTEYCDHAANNGAIPALVKVLQTIPDPGVLVESVLALSNISDQNPTHQGTIGGTQGAMTSIVNLFEDCIHKPLLAALTKAVSKISENHDNNQNTFITEGVALPLIALTRGKIKDCQLNAVEAIHGLATGNPHTQAAILAEGAVLPLLQLLRKNRAPQLQERTAAALWALAGDSVEERRNMAGMMGVPLLIEFLTSLSERLHYIGSEGLSVLAQGPLNQQTAIAHANGVHPLVRLLRSDKEHIVLSVIRTLRFLSVSVGYVPHAANQNTVAQSRGIKFLVAMMAHSQNELIQVEAAHTLGCVALGHNENLEEIKQNLDFSYVRVLKMMYSQNPLVRLLAGAALAAFAYNSLTNQKDIAEQGGVRFNCFVPFLQSEDEFFRCNAAFQVVVLARIIPDEEQAISSAAGIKLLVDLLQDSKSNEILSLAADCIARLAHTRAGVPSAFVSIEAVNLLCDLMSSEAEQVSGCASIALSYLSHNHPANRQLLNRCRVDPYLMKVLTYYTDKSKLSADFIEGWKHYKQIGLPPVNEDRGNHKPLSKGGARPPTLTSTDDTAASTNMLTSPTNLNSSTHDDDKATGRSSRTSRNSQQSAGDLSQRSQMSEASTAPSKAASVAGNDAPSEGVAPES